MKDEEQLCVRAGEPWRREEERGGNFCENC